MMRFRFPCTWGERSGYILTAFLIGIACRSLDPVNSWAKYTPLFVAVGIACVVAIISTQDRIRFIFYCIFACLIGIVRFEYTVPAHTDGVLPWIGEQVTMIGQVIEMQRASFGLSVLVEINTIENDLISGPGNYIRVTMPRSTSIFPGDRVSIDCVLAPVVDTIQKPIQRRLFAKQGIWAVCGKSHTTIISFASRLRPHIVLARWRSWLTSRIEASIPENNARLLEGILYGERGMSQELQDAFRTAGLTHIIAVSGSNVSILHMMIFSCILALGLSRRQAFWHMSWMLIVFVLFVGGSASVLRAASMAWFAIYGRYLGRLLSTRRLLIVSACVLCLWDPWQLVYDIGFGLSFLATIGLLEVLPRIEQRLMWMPNYIGLRESIATTLSTTLLTAPYGALIFDRMPLAGLVTNAFALPIVPWAMLFGALSAVIGPTRFSFVHWPVQGCLDMLIFIGRASQRVPWLDIRW